MREGRRVFVVQRPARFDHGRQGWVNRYDLTPAAEHGELVFLLKPGNIYHDAMAAALDRLREMLAGYDPARDHVLAVGDPVAIAAAVMVASRETGGRVSLLKYDRLRGRYDPYLVAV